MNIETRSQFEAWAASFDLDLKPARCTMGELQYCELDTDFAWQAWKVQEDSIEQVRARLAVVEQENHHLKSEATKAFAARIAEKHLDQHALRDAERYRYLREYPDMLSRPSDKTCLTPNEVDALVDIARFGKIDA
jgi:regulator of protease activity HflC (stomatin/prohibitin superfamily)